METSIRIRYNGKKFSSIEKSPAPDEDILVTVAMAMDVEAALEPLQPDIEREGGHVSINLKGPSMFEIYAEDISDKLKRKVMKALTRTG